MICLILTLRFLLTKTNDEGVFYLKVVPHCITEETQFRKEETEQLPVKEIRNFITVDTNTLKVILCCGRKTAVEVGILSNAKITIGKRVLWNISLIQKYLDNIAF